LIHLLFLACSIRFFSSRGRKGKNLPMVQSSCPALSKTSPATQDELARRVQ
jgi:hypothetical protein